MPLTHPTTISQTIRDCKLEVIALLALSLGMYYPTLYWLYRRWIEPNSNYGHIIMIPFVAAFLFLRLKPRLGGIRPGASSLGLWISIAAVFLHIASRLIKVNFVSGLSLPILLMGLILYLFGKEAARRCLFAVAYLFFMIPVPIVMIREISLKLKLLAAHWAAVLMKWCGMRIVEEGSFLHIPTGTLIVGDVCSGLKYLTALIALGALYAYLAELSPIKRWIIFAASVPVAVIANVVRIVTLGLIGWRWGIEAVEGAAHYLAGFFIFVVALILLSVVHGIVAKLPGESLRYGK
ncbi:MAG: exosortase/archaeosortase family protein [Candidatus Omnitrophota bacterium]